MTAPAIPDSAEVAAQIFEATSRELGFGAHVFPPTVRDAHDDARQALADEIAAVRQLEADLAELDGKRDLLPAAGYQRLRGEAVAQADVSVHTARQRGMQALARLKDELRAAAVPKVDPQRETLARDELKMLLAEAPPAEVRARALRIARRGSRDATAALLSPYGRGLLETKGLSGRSLDDAMDALTKMVAASAAERAGSTVEEIVASRAYESVDRLAAAIGNAGNSVRRLTRR